MGMGFLFGMMKMLEILIEVLAAQHCKYTKCHTIVYFKMVM